MQFLSDDKVLAVHVLRAIAARKGARTSLIDLAKSLDVRRADVRRVVTKLHSEGFVDALRMRLTMRGLALVAMLEGKEPRPIRISRPRVAA